MRNKTLLDIVGHKRASDDLFVVKAKGWILTRLQVAVTGLHSSLSCYPLEMFL